MGTWKLLGAGIAIMLAATGYAWHSGIISVSSVSGKTAAAANAQAIRPVPVTTSVVQESEFPISHTGMGTVQAYNTVTVKVRVDGEIQKIAFQEGQAVEIGDLLAVIDPRPYQALLQQAEADSGGRDDPVR